MIQAYARPCKERVGADTKRMLCRAMKRILPEKVRRRREKLGFSTPEESWFRGPMRGLILDGIEATLRRFPDLLNATKVKALAADMLEGRPALDFTLGGSRISRSGAIGSAPRCRRWSAHVTSMTDRFSAREG
jgi:asparagine synthetase B (glutamine-hydrolysing)